MTIQDESGEARAALATCVGALPLFTFAPAWIEQSAAFVHPDARLGKAYLKLLLAAWRSAPAGTLPASHQYLAEVTGLPLALVDEHYTTLTDGFELVDARLRHTRLAAHLDMMVARFGKSLEEFALSTAIAAQNPEQFSLVTVEAAGTRARGKCGLPKGFGYEAHPELIDWAAKHGFPEPGDRAWVMERFIDYSLKKGSKWVSWPAAFRNWAVKDMQEFGNIPPSQVKGLPPRPAGASPFARFNGGASKGEVARDHNVDVFASLNQSKPVSVASMRGGGA